MIQTPRTQIEKISEKLIVDLCRTDEHPDDWLPHTVYVEEVGEDEKLGDIPVYTRYTLEDFKQDGSCTLCDTEGVCRSGHLKEICIDWLSILRDRYLELCVEQGLWRERAIRILEQESDASLPDILEFVGEHWQNLASDEENIEAFRRWIAPAASQVLPKELFAFVWPFELMLRNATDEQILAAYENGPSRSLREGDDVWDEDDDTLYEVRKLTPDELAAEINDSDCAFGQCYVRFIEV
ncbi:hypothetical protein A3BBH6_06850 [Alistipes onderdonkii subsp. vulgaris]|uniref:hypothetical protein n=1 Tax=Alistipes onderdonkii TaxID=328813 RepID=UPI0011418255|nr:hypothetical protein [Alistipes onderdonkii]BBL00449.1 hypothetical protein A3BBH6_06850 [Alistipes onderdonkii subsp. vulgaris]